MMSMKRRSLFALPALGAAPVRPRQTVTAAVKNWGNKPMLFVNGKPVFPAFYALTDALGGRWSFDELPSLAIEQFAKTGFKLFQVDLFLESVWPKEGPLDITLARRPGARARLSRRSTSLISRGRISTVSELLCWRTRGA